MKKYCGSTIGLSGRESVAMKSNYCEIDPTKVDKYEFVMKINYQWTDNEIKRKTHVRYI